MSISKIAFRIGKNKKWLWYNSTKKKPRKINKLFIVSLGKLPIDWVNYRKKLNNWKLLILN